ncbi:MAG: hypothetical protein CVU39_20985 [Chloroflexi bacterium HGW-Chloroflexi-10]|nr:MAG: hypothetical protein CVU39_20985 [Chloroflexi bacterium HGW-Chloroflexi-10]
MLPVWMRKIGKLRLFILTNIISIGLSLLLTLFLQTTLFGGITLAAVIISILVPILMGLPISFILLHLAFELDKARHHMELLSITDELTGAYNRRHFLQHMDQEIERSRRYHCVFRGNRTAIPEYAAQ